MSFDKFMAVYEKHLSARLSAHPEEYAFNLEKLPEVLVSIREAIRTGGFSKNSPTLRATCKELGIKHTYTAIAQFIARVE